MKNVKIIALDDIVVFQDNAEILRFPYEALPEELQASFDRVPCKGGYMTDKELVVHCNVQAHVHSEHSNLDGAMKDVNIPKYVANDTNFDVEVDGKNIHVRVENVIALTDHGVMTGTFAFYNACKEHGVKPIVGCEVYAENVIDGEKKNNHMILLCKNEQGYKNLCEILARAEQNFYRHPQVSLEMLEELHNGLICTSACLGGEIPRAIQDGAMDRAEEAIDILSDIFGEDFYLEVQRHEQAVEEVVNNRLVKFAQEKGIKLIATSDAHYAKPEDAFAHEILLGIGTHKTINDPQRFRFEGTGYHLYSEEEMASIFSDLPQVWDGLYEIANKCNFEFTTGKLFMPDFPCPDGMDQDDYFCNLVDDGFARRFTSFASPEKEEEYRARLQYEKEIILKMGFSGYFLIVQDYIAYARSIGGYVGPGRGSAVGSLAAYCLGITNLDPIPYGLLFERFLNPERISMPDC